MPASIAKYYLYALPTSHNCQGSQACTRCVKSNALDTSYAVSDSGTQYTPIVKIINVTMLDLEKCPPWLIGTPTLYEPGTRSVYKGQHALAKLEGVAESPARQFWVTQSDAQAMRSGSGIGVGGPGALGRGAGTSAGVNRPSALASASKSQRGMQNSRLVGNVPRGAQGAQGMGGSNALRGAWNAHKRMSADALSKSMAQSARTRFGGGGSTTGGDTVGGAADAKAPPASTGASEDAFSMSTLQPAGVSSTTTAGNFALDPAQYDTPEARAAKIISKKTMDAAPAGIGVATAATAPPDGDYASTSPVDLAAEFKKRQQHDATTTRSGH